MDDFSEAVEIIPGRYYLAVLTRPDSLSRSPIAASSFCYCIDQDLLYEPFYADFGPLNLGRTYRFCQITAKLLQEAEERGKKLYLYCGPQPQQRANAAVLVGAFQVLLMGRSAEIATELVSPLQPFMPFRDASCGPPCFNLQVQHCLGGLEKAKASGFLDAKEGAWRFDIDEYEHYEQVENGDLNWIIPGKLVAFSGPAARPTDYVGFRAMVPEDYWDYYHSRRVTSVVRLNRRVYDRKRFLDGGLRHHEMYFPDGSCPNTELLLNFLEIAEKEPGALAIHCKAGLGRTGVLICSYIMKHYRFTAEEVIGYIRICRPGSVIGPQQNFLQEIQALMWKEGDAWRAANGPKPPPLYWGPAAPGRADALSAVVVPYYLTSCAKTRAGHPVFSLVVDATGDGASSRQGSGGGGSSGGRPSGDGSPASASTSSVAPGAAFREGAPAGRPQTSNAAAHGSSNSSGSNTSGSGSGTLQALINLLGNVGSNNPIASALMLSRHPPAGHGPSAQHGAASAASGAARSSSSGGGSRQNEYIFGTWHNPLPSALHPPSPAAAPAGSLTAHVRPQSNIVRALAPNGQPRKLPASALEASGKVEAACSGQRHGDSRGAAGSLLTALRPGR